MDFKFTAEEQKIVNEVHELIAREKTPELIKELDLLGGIFGGPESKKIIQKIGEKGWLCPTWPKEYGGIESSEMLRFAVMDEIAYSGLPSIYVGACMAGPTILKLGSEEMKSRLLPDIAHGKVEYALGYTEPQAGSDLASLEIRAEEKGDYFVLNGQKMFNTSSHVADYHWLAARTDPNVAKHKGISLMVVDLKSPGITIRPMITMAGWRTNEVFYDDVKVPKTSLVGEINRGFYYIMMALDFERMFTVGHLRHLFEELVEYVKEIMVNGSPLGKNHVVRQKLAEIAIELEASQLLYYQLAYLLDMGKTVNYQASMQKVFASEMSQHLTSVGMQIMGLCGQLQAGSKYVPLGGRFEWEYRSSIIETIYGGTSEIQRNIIALRGLGLPAH